MHWGVGRKQLFPLPLLLAALQLSIYSTAAVRDIHSDHDLVPGWLGSDYQSPDYTPESLGGRTRRMKVLDADARIFLFENFLSPEECDSIMKLAEPRLQRSNVVSAAKSDATHGTTTEMSKIRTSDGMFFSRGENKVVKAVEERIAAWSLLPSYNGEGLQVLRYQNSQKYEPHWDYFFHKDGISNGGNRYATVLTYLSDVEEGGETIFPFIPAPSGAENVGFSDCARKYLSVRPKKGDAILFHSIQPNGAFEKRSMHGSCPVIKGTKWSMAKWIHVGRYAVGPGDERRVIGQFENPMPQQQAECKDTVDTCQSWSMQGECYKNEVWMVGTPSHPGNCLSSCLRCDVWKAHVALQSQPHRYPRDEEEQGTAQMRR